MDTPLDAEQRLRDRAVRIAAPLRDRSVRPGDRVAVLLERSADFVIAVTAVVLARGAHVAIDTGIWAYGPDAHIPVDAACLLTRQDAEHPGDWSRIERTFRDGNAATWGAT